MNENKIKKMLDDNPKFRRVLEKAVEIEEQRKIDLGFIGWQSYEVRAPPEELEKLQEAGIITSMFTEDDAFYSLVNRNMVKKVLGIK